jgi:hypothetical protein
VAVVALGGPTFRLLPEEELLDDEELELLDDELLDDGLPEGGLLDEELLDDDDELDEGTIAAAAAAALPGMRRKTRGCGLLSLASFLVRGRATMFGSRPIALLFRSRSRSFTLSFSAS